MEDLRTFYELKLLLKLQIVFHKLPLDLKFNNPLTIIKIKIKS